MDARESDVFMKAALHGCSDSGAMQRGGAHFIQQGKGWSPAGAHLGSKTWILDLQPQNPVLGMLLFSG